MKRYIRFFENRNDTIPVNSYEVCPGGNYKSNCISSDSDTIVNHINDWMNQHDNGKVDFVWLN